MIVENTRLNDCFYDKKDWRACKAEVSHGNVLKRIWSQDAMDCILILCKMEAFKACWKKAGNDKRTDMKDA